MLIPMLKLPVSYILFLLRVPRIPLVFTHTLDEWWESETLSASLPSFPKLGTLETNCFGLDSLVSSLEISFYHLVLIIVILIPSLPRFCSHTIFPIYLPRFITTCLHSSGCLCVRAITGPMYGHYETKHEELRGTAWEDFRIKGKHFRSTINQNFWVLGPEILKFNIGGRGQRIFWLKSLNLSTKNVSCSIWKAREIDSWIGMNGDASEREFEWITKNWYHSYYDGSDIYYVTYRIST